MEIALLGLRIVVGLAFAAHGSQKLFGAFGGAGIAGTARFFERIGLRPGKVHAWQAGTTEFVGGFLIALGLVTPFAATALIGVMVAATLTVTLSNGFFVDGNGYEYNLILAATLFALAGIGPGDWSLDSAVGIDLTGTLSAVGALAAGALAGFGAVLSGRLVPDRDSGHGRRYAERQAA
jgi:putative oxidoreductase